MQRRDRRCCRQHGGERVPRALSVLIMALLVATCSSFFLTAPTLPSAALRQHHGLVRKQQNHVLSTRGAGRQSPKMLLEGAVGSAPIEALVSWGMLLAEEMEAPPNIYGPIALGGVTIVLSGVFGAYVISLLVKGMSPEELQELTESLQGANEKEDIEAEGAKQQKIFRKIEKDEDQFRDPTLGMGSQGTPTGRRLEQIESESEKALQTDIASMDDEYE